MPPTMRLSSPLHYVPAKQNHLKLPEMSGYFTPQGLCSSAPSHPKAPQRSCLADICSSFQCHLFHKAFLPRYRSFIKHCHVPENVQRTPFNSLGNSITQVWHSEPHVRVRNQVSENVNDLSGIPPLMCGTVELETQTIVIRA